MCRFMFPNFNFNIERWKWNDEYRIYVSTAGRCKDEHKRLLPVKINSSGYCMVKTACGHRLVHRLVMKTWRPIPDDENLTVDHLDHNKRNNDVRNLEWVTEAENKRRAKQDLYKEAAAPVGQKTQTTKKQVIHGRRIRTGKQTFENIDEAIAWMRKSGFLNDSYIKENIESKIANAIKNNKLYCGRKWKYVNN